jgi:hypothetical protein
MKFLYTFVTLAEIDAASHVTKLFGRKLPSTDVSTIVLLLADVIVPVILFCVTVLPIIALLNVKTLLLITLATTLETVPLIYVLLASVPYVFATIMVLFDEET